MGQNHSKPKTRHRNSTYTISSIYHPSVYNIIYQNWLHLHTSPFLSTLERPEADAKCWRLPAESRLLLGKEAAAPNTWQVALLLGDSWDD